MAETGSKEGLSTGADLAIAQAGALPGNQAEMFPAAAAAVEPGGRGPGRPAGARNKRTDEVRDMVLGACTRHPLLVLAEYATGEIGEMAKKLGLNRAEFAKLQLQAIGKVLEYVEQKMPVSVDLEHHKSVTLIIGTVGEGIEAGDGGGDQVVLNLNVADKPEENQ